MTPTATYYHDSNMLEFLISEGESVTYIEAGDNFILKDSLSGEFVGFQINSIFSEGVLYNEIFDPIIEGTENLYSRFGLKIMSGLLEEFYEEGKT